MKLAPAQYMFAAADAVLAEWPTKPLSSTEWHDLAIATGLNVPMCKDRWRILREFDPAYDEHAALVLDSIDRDDYAKLEAFSLEDIRKRCEYVSNRKFDKDLGSFLDCPRLIHHDGAPSLSNDTFASRTNFHVRRMVVSPALPTSVTRSRRGIFGATFFSFVA